MATTTVVEIIERAKSAADMVSSGFVTTAEWVRWLNVENRWLAKFVARSGYVMFESPLTIAATGAVSYPLTVGDHDPLAILGVYEYVGGRYRRLKQGDVFDGPPHVDTTTAGSAEYFRVWQSSTTILSISFFPNPATGTYIVMTIPDPATLTVNSSVYFPTSMEERLVLGLARRALAKEESSTTEINRMIQECEREVEELCWDRVMAGHQQVRNVDKIERGWLDRPQVPSRERWLWV